MNLYEHRFEKKLPQQERKFLVMAIDYALKETWEISQKSLVRTIKEESNEK